MFKIFFILIFFTQKSVFCEWEIPDELLPPKWLFDVIGGFSPFLGYFPLLRDAQTRRKWLYLFIKQGSNFKPFLKKENILRYIFKVYFLRYNIFLNNN